MPKLLTKSKYMQGLESDCLLWRAVNDPDSLPKPDAFTQAKFDAGHEVGVLAKKLFSDGVDLEGLDFKSNIEKTKEHVKARKTIFEAGFMVDGLFSRADILVPVSKDKWDVVEVKSSTEAKEVHVKDLAFQKFVYKKFGLKINKLFVLHVNKEYVLKKTLSIPDFFTKTDVTDQVATEFENVAPNVNHMLSVIALPTCPAFDYHDIPKTEYGNACVDEFMSSLPTGSIFELYNARKKKIIELYDNDIKLLKDAESDDLTDKQQIQIACAKSGERFIDKKNIAKFVKSLTYPIYHLDFETFNSVIPLFDGCKPNQQIPFQYSLHIEDKKSTTHKEFLFTASGDPRKAFLESLLRDLGTTGTILVYNQTFEVSRLKELAFAFPSHGAQIEAVLSRIVDLLVPFRSFYFYDNKQGGSCSIKEVLPVFSSLSYKDLAVSNGTMAMNLYFDHFVKGLPCENKDQLARSLLEYCKQDTYGMVLVLNKLKLYMKTIC